MDEGGQLHERFGHRFDLLVLGGGGRSETRFQETGLWMFILGPALLLTLVGGVVYLRRRLSIRSDAFVKALAGVVIFVGAAAPGDFLANYVSGDTSTIQTAAEEFGEMVGVTLIMWAAVTLLAQRQPIVVSEATPAPGCQPVQASIGAFGVLLADKNNDTVMTNLCGTGLRQSRREGKASLVKQLDGAPIERPRQG